MHISLPARSKDGKQLCRFCGKPSCILGCIDSCLLMVVDRGVSYQDLVCSLICTTFGRPDPAVVPLTQESDPQGVLDFEEGVSAFVLT